MGEQRRVLHLLSTNQFYGAEHVACRLIRLFDESEAVEAAYASPDGPIADALAAQGVCFVPMKRLLPGALRRAIKSFHPDVIHAHDVKATMLASFFARKARLVSTLHVNHPNMRRFSCKAWLYALAVRRADRVFFVSRDTMDAYALRSRIEVKSVLMPNHVNATFVRRLAAGPTDSVADIVILGRLDAQKDPLRALEILRRARERVPHLTAAFLGDGEMTEEVRERAHALGLDGAVHFCGFCANPYPTLAAAKLLLMPSRFEGLPIAALEALTLGVPVVATPTGGLLDVIRNGENGILSASDEGLAEAMVTLLTDDSMRARMHACATEESDRTDDDDRALLLAAYRA